MDHRLAGLLAGLLLVGAAGAETKDETTAGMLGVMPGLGAGYYYLGSLPKAIAFTVVDGALIGGLIEAESDGTRWTLGLALLGTHTFQCLDGIASARRQNRRLQRLPLELSVGEFGFGDSRFELFRDGGAGRDLALALERADRAAPPLRLRADPVDPGLALTYRLRF